MIHALKPFTPLDLNLEIEAGVTWQGANLQLCFDLVGDVDYVDLPTLDSKQERAVGLWEATCFELFIKDSNSTEYVEFNFAPCGSWNCYTFEYYRSELKELPTMQSTDVKIVTQYSKNTYQYKVEINTTELPQILQKVGQRKIGLNAVMKTGKELSYWALNHPKNQPDFHDIQGMVISI